MIDLLLRLVKRGPLTSEFWLALLAVAAPLIAEISPEAVHAWADSHGIAGGIVVAVYIAARAYVKGQTARAVGEQMSGEAAIAAAVELGVQQRQAAADVAAGSLVPGRPDDSPPPR